MKYILANLLAIIFILLSINSLHSQEIQDKDKRYFIESAHIKYIISGNTTGTEELYFDQWGKREMNKIESKTETTFYSVTTKREENTLNILVGDYSYSIDMKKKTGVKTLNAGVTTMKSLGNGKSPRQYGKEMLKAIGGKKIGEEEILGRNCEIWKALGVKVWLWKGIPLKTSSKMVGIKRIREAVEIETNIKIENSKFEVPEGVLIVDYTE